MHIQLTCSTILQISLSINPERYTDSDYTPFGATSCSSPFRKSGLALNPFHQFVKEAFEGEGAAPARDDAFEGGSERAGRGFWAVVVWGC
jgi:hypothetical protein